MKKVNKNQALYKHLPGSWMEYSLTENSNDSFIAKVLYWNSVKANGIHEDKVKRDIKRRINSFEKAGGDVSEFKRNNLDELLEIVEAKMDENFPDIQVQIDPKLFYCIHCGRIKYVNTSIINEAPKCECGRKMKQIPFVYACECGYAESISPPLKELTNLRYRPSAKNNGKDNYRFFEKKGSLEKPIEMVKRCNCGSVLRPVNATDNKPFYAQSGKCVNLLDEKLKRVYESYGDKADKLVLAKWLGIIDQNKYLNILKNPENFFEPKESEIEEAVKEFVAQGISEDLARKILTSKLNETNIKTVSSAIDNELSGANYTKEKLELLVSEISEFDTIKNPPSKIDFASAGLKLVNNGNFDNLHEIYELNERLGISNIQVSHDIKIINYTYGFTRKAVSPDIVGDGKILKLNAFAQKDKFKIYCSQLETEGLLIEFDRNKLYEFLRDNSLIDYSLNLENERESKKYFMEKIDSSAINHFAAIDPVCVETKVIYSVLHTISHLLIRSAGLNSGISKESYAEIIFPNIPAIFIYPTTEQGHVLGSVSGMFENNYRKFIQDAFEGFEQCSFDPICTTHHDGSCFACTMLSEVSCEHFNKDLSRKYLYGGTIEKQWPFKLNIKKGFWK